MILLIILLFAIKGHSTKVQLRTTNPIKPMYMSHFMALEKRNVKKEG